MDSEIRPVRLVSVNPELVSIPLVGSSCQKEGITGFLQSNHIGNQEFSPASANNLMG